MNLMRILMCGHPNVLGCPNHGDTAREIWRGLADENKTDSLPDAFANVYLFAWGESENQPIPYVLTQRGLLELHGEPPDPATLP